MKKICRLSIPYNLRSQDPEEGEGQAMNRILQAAFDATGTAWADILTAYRSEGKPNDTHWGNWVLTPVADNAAVEKIDQYFQQMCPKSAQCDSPSYLDMRREVIERADIEALAPHVGKKVSMNMTGWLMNNVGEIGTIYSVDLTKTLATITIKKFRSRKHGWVIEEQQDAMVRLV